MDNHRRVPGPRGRWFCAAALAAQAVVLLSIPATVDYDTTFLLQHAHGLLQCIHDGRSVCPEAGKFPLFQLALSVVGLWAGASRPAMGLSLAWLNTLAFAALLAVTWSTLRHRSRAVASLTVVTLASGALVWYTRRSFGEMVAALGATALVAALLRGWHPLAVVFLAFAVCATKETAFGFAIVLGAMAIWARGERESRAWQGLSLGFGSLAGVAAGAVLNLYRFGTPLNRDYAEEASWVPPTENVFHHALGLWLAPTGGVWLYWPALGMLLLSTSVALAKERRTVPLLAGMAGFLTVLTFGLARWWTPFGWWCWGPRLMVPWMPALAVLGAYAASDRLERWVSRLHSSGVWLPVCIALAATSAMHLAATADLELVNRHFARAITCSEPKVVGTDVFFPCLLRFMWTDWGLLGEASSALVRGPIGARAILYAGGIFVLAWFAPQQSASTVRSDVGPRDTTTTMVPWRRPSMHHRDRGEKVESE